MAYVWSRLYGNYLAFSAASGQYDYPEQIPNNSGLLPGDRTHLLRCYGSYRVVGGLTAGAVLTWQSGTPVSDLGATFFGPGNSFLRPRGSVGRTPAIWDLGLRLGYTPAKGLRGEAYRPTVTFDLYHVASARRVTQVDQVHFKDVDGMGNQIGENPNFLQPIRFQPPMAARLGMAVAF